MCKSVAGNDVLNTWSFRRYTSERRYNADKWNTKALFENRFKNTKEQTDKQTPLLSYTNDVSGQHRRSKALVMIAQIPKRQKNVNLVVVRLDKLFWLR